MNKLPTKNRNRAVLVSTRLVYLMKHKPSKVSVGLDIQNKLIESNEFVDNLIQDKVIEDTNTFCDDLCSKDLVTSLLDLIELLVHR